MGKLKQAILLNFRAKVLLPVLGVMVLLMAVSMWLVNERFTRQAEAGAARQLATDEAVLKTLQEIRARNLESRYRTALSDVRWKSLAALLNAEHGKLGEELQRTLRGTLDELLGENVADVITLTTETGESLTVTRARDFLTGTFETSCAAAVRKASEGRVAVDLVMNCEELFDVVTVPIRTGENKAIVGAVTFGVRNALVQEFAQLTRNELVLFLNGELVAATLPSADTRGILPAPQHAADDDSGTVARVELKDASYLSLSGGMPTGDARGGLSYVMLSSLDKPLRALRDTQRLILLVGTLAVLVAGLVMWLFVRRVTEPLEELFTSVEAVGHGDLTRRIEVRTSDELGELAGVFNRMTENLRASREEHEATVERLKTTQANLVQSEKLSGIGEFVAGVAHELNNPLTSVLGFSELLRQNAETSPQQKRHLEMIHKSAQRCTRIVQSLLSFSRRHQPERKLVCVNRIVEASVEILAYQMRTSNIEVGTQLDPHLPKAMVDGHQIQQVLVNLINNARQAIEAHSPKGCVRVTTDTAGDHVRITIQDSGPGIPESNLSKIFDPFFTTKEVGKGTGLGLSLCYGIVNEHGGRIEVRSRFGEGATFVIHLPIAAPADEIPEVYQTTFFTKPASKEGSGKRVLVIDDEPPILEMLSDALGDCGYQVDTAADGEAALRRLGEQNYDLALCDWKMPGLNGRQVYEQVQASNPAMCERFIFITGDVVNERTQRFLQEQKRVCLSKPFSLADFRAAVRQATVLDV